MRGRFFCECPRLDAAPKALLNKAYEESMVERPQEDQRHPKKTVAAVGASLGPPSLSSDETPPPGVEAEELVEEDKSSSENEQRGRRSRLPRQLYGQEEGTRLPGEPGRTGLSGHRGYPKGNPLRARCSVGSSNSSGPVTPVLWRRWFLISQHVMGPTRAGFSSEKSRVRDSPRLRPRRGTEEFAGQAIPSRGSDEPGPEELGGVLNW